MKTNCWLILGMMMASSVLAQTGPNTVTRVPAPAAASASETAPAAATPAAAPVKHKKRAAKPKRAPLNEPTVTLAPGPAEVAVSDLNVRGQAGLKGEVISKLNKGDKVTVMSQINLDKHETGEPAQWAKIALPSSTPVWVNTKYIDAATKTVIPNRLNLRAGPGENYSVLGVIEKGATVDEISTKGAWTQINPPADAYAFVAAMYLKQESSGNLAANPAPSTETTPTTPVAVVPNAPETTAAPSASVTEGTPVATPPANATPATPEANPSSTTAGQPPVAENTAAPETESNLPPRVVSHEGVVGPVGSIIAPTAYVLYDPSSRQNINFLYTTSTNLDIGRYSGMRIVVTGEESIAQRWTNTPLLTIQRIVVLDTNAIPKAYYPTPRQRG